MNSGISLALLGWALFGPAQAFAGELPVAGWIERVRLAPGAVVVQAKLDTGADSSSLHATDIRWFRRDDRDWVAFDVVDRNARVVRLERPVKRIAQVKSVAGGVQRRPTVTLGVCLGAAYRIADVNLVDRSRLTEKMLVGRTFLESTFLVDSSRKHLHEPSCGEQEAP